MGCQCGYIQFAGTENMGGADILQELCRQRHCPATHGIKTWYDHQVFLLSYHLKKNVKNKRHANSIDNIFKFDVNNEHIQKNDKKKQYVSCFEINTYWPLFSTLIFSTLIFSLLYYRSFLIQIQGFAIIIAKSYKLQFLQIITDYGTAHIFWHVKAIGEL